MADEAPAAPALRSAEREDLQQGLRLKCSRQAARGLAIALLVLVPSKGDANGILDQPRIVLAVTDGHPLAVEDGDQGASPAAVGLVEDVAPLGLPAQGQPLPTLDLILEYARATFPEAPEVAARITACEINGYPDPGVAAIVFDTERAYGGPMQLARAVWAPVFAAVGWQWDSVVMDLPTHFAAARIVYERAGGFGPWGCV